ncbi:hypothetical protein Q75_04005 [Bacillus coahuilensis p1.1.43]|uniref:Uncharacterized protein n=1 Tax=Bacillus coahuilensis p1.1.43 TaxID=1150625 RepID=A0A147KAW7_9BACI|nr:hypothetical protein Q75_04005 [Bacillus coahuilensis p1.1.43]
MGVSLYDSSVGSKNSLYRSYDFIFYSLLFQYVSKWKPFILGSILIAFIFAFVFENVAIWLNIYAPIVWEHIYSFPIFILIPLIGKKIVDSITSASNEP